MDVFISVFTGNKERDEEKACKKKGGSHPLYRSWEVRKTRGKPRACLGNRDSEKALACRKEAEMKLRERK